MRACKSGYHFWKHLRAAVWSSSNYFSKENCFYLSTNIVFNVTEIKHLQLLWPLTCSKPQSNCDLKMETTSILKKGLEWPLTLLVLTFVPRAKLDCSFPCCAVLDPVWKPSMVQTSSFVFIYRKYSLIFTKCSIFFYQQLLMSWLSGILKSNKRFRVRST